jgi:hypothetical protein
MQVWASRKLLAAGLLFTSAAFAQDVPRMNALRAARLATADAAEHRSQAAHRGFASVPAVAVSNHHWWYEDYPRSREIFPEYRYLQPVAPPAEEDFSPATMKWSLSGRHPLLPTVEIAGMDTWSPDTWHVPDPSQQYGHFQSDRTRAALGTKIKHLILAQLRY